MHRATSRGSGGGDGLCNLGNLIAGTDDLLALTVLVELHVFVLPLCTLPDLDFAATADDTDSHCGKEIVGGVGVHVDSTVEHGGGVLADSAVDHGLPSRVLLDEICDVVNHTSNSDETATILGLILEVVPFHDWQRIKRNTPVKLAALLVKLLLLLLDSAFLDLVLLELLEIVCQTHLLPHPDAPFGGVILESFNGVTVVGGKLVVEIVVTLTESHKSRDDMVTRRVAVVKRLVTEPMSQGVDTECGLLDEEDA